MSCEFTCDGCGKKAPAGTNGMNWFKPSEWFERTQWEESGVKPLQVFTVCSRECIDLAEKEKIGYRTPIIPI